MSASSTSFTLTFADLTPGQLYYLLPGNIGSGQAILADVQINGP